MASKLCCTTEQESRSSSPWLPNARISESTPAKLPLLPKRPPSQNSHFTSARSEDLHELRQIFDNAKDVGGNRPSPPKAVSRARFTRPSVYSLHSLHKMKSMHSLIRQKFSRDVSKKPSGNQVKSNDTKKSLPAAADTVLRQPNEGHNLQLKITKEDLRKDLLSDKKPDEGGYDSDAKVLDDIAKNVGKRSPNKRPSLRSIDWTPSTASKPTPGSSSKSRHSMDLARDVRPYQISQYQHVSLSARFSQVFSTPNFQNNNQKGTQKRQERKLKRSHSTTSIELPAPLPLSPPRLPGLEANEYGGIPWSVALTESLRLSRFPSPPHSLTLKASKTSLRVYMGSKDNGPQSQSERSESPVQLSQRNVCEPQTPATVVQIRVQEPTVVNSPRPSTSMKGEVHENVPPPPQKLGSEGSLEYEEENSRQSVHLYSMRISHHLRSGSLLSWDNLTDTSDFPTHPTLRDRSTSDLGRMAQTQKQLIRHERQSSSSGFTSSRVPTKWGKVVPHEIPEDKSSVYSSRPQSPPGSLGGSMINLSQTTPHGPSKNSLVDFINLRRSNSYPTDNNASPRTVQCQGLTNLCNVTIHSTLKDPRNGVSSLARNNSVASTKKSKFREDFSPSPPKKRLIRSASIIRFLNLKRSSFRSRSETNVRQNATEIVVDGTLERSHTIMQRERRRSISIASLEVEQDALGKDKKASPMWERALKNYQDERATMLLPKNKSTVCIGPFRERSVSASKTQTSTEEITSPRELSSAKRFSAPLLGSPAPSKSNDNEASPFFMRRTAHIGKNNGDLGSSHEAQIHFDHQTDTADTVGAWGRYPSHSRLERTLSATHLDHVDSRDFALEAAIKFAAGTNNDANNDNIDPIARPLTPPLLAGEKKRKKKVGNARMAKSNSMTFGKTFLKNYAKIFKSQSIEFYRHGHGHRSSVTTGGTLEYPELEILPNVWRRGAIEERSGERSHDSNEDKATKEGHGQVDKKGKGKLEEESSVSTIRPLGNVGLNQRNVLPSLDGQVDQQHAKDTARAWSAYYENCLPLFPRTSTEVSEADFGLEEFGILTRHSFESKGASVHSHSMPSRFARHSRNTSHMGRLSVASNRGVGPDFISMGEGDGGVDKRSLVSVRRSTMDLIALYKEQEVTEREKVLGLMWMESKKEGKILTSL